MPGRESMRVMSRSKPTVGAGRVVEAMAPIVPGPRASPSGHPVRPRAHRFPPCNECAPTPVRPAVDRGSPCAHPARPTRRAQPRAAAAPAAAGTRCDRWRTVPLRATSAVSRSPFRTLSGQGQVPGADADRPTRHAQPRVAAVPAAAWHPVRHGRANRPRAVQRVHSLPRSAVPGPWLPLDRVRSPRGAVLLAASVLAQPVA